MADIEETKDGKVILTCDCGIVHKMKWNAETEQIEIKSSIKPKEEKPETKNNGTEKKRTSIFGNK